MTRDYWSITAGALLLVASSVAYFAYVPVWSERISDDWSWKTFYSGTVAWADDKGNYAKIKSSTDAKREFTIDSIDQKTGLVKIQDFYQTLDPKSGKVNWESRLYFLIDPKTGRSGDVDRGEVYGVFPRFTEKRDYVVDTSYLNPITMKFVQQETIGSLVTYHFKYQGDIEYTESYLGTADYQGVDIKPGQEVLCTEDGYIFSLWVEPVTGEIVKWREGCYSGDAVFDMAAKQRLYNLSQWDGEMSVASIEATVDRLQWERVRLLFLLRYLSPGLAFLGVVILCLGLVLRQRARSVAQMQG